MDSALRLAIEEGHIDDAARLFDAGQIIDWRAERSRDLPLLHTASEDGNLPMVRLLLEHGADGVINEFDDLARTPLMHASRNGHVAVIAELLCRGADVNAVDERHGGDTALLHAIAGGHPAGVEALIKAGADPRIIGSRDRNACKLSHDIAAERRDDPSQKIVDAIHRSQLHSWTDCRLFPAEP